jgi:hypothetical protein
MATAGTLGIAMIMRMNAGVRTQSIVLDLQLLLATVPLIEEAFEGQGQEWQYPGLLDLRGREKALHLWAMPRMGLLGQRRCR